MVIILLLFGLFCCYSSSANNSSNNNNNNINLPLSPWRESTNSNNKMNPWEILKRHAVASLSRAQRHHLKHSSSVKVPLSPRGYGEYTVNLSFGTPPQTLHFTMDTGSSLTWFPCALRQEYKCTNCDFPGMDPTAKYPVFTPNKSSSFKIVPCQSTQCRWLFPDPHCSKNHTNCGYRYGYGIGNTTGLLINETLALGRWVVDNFTVGCSISSADLQEGNAGFGRGPLSLPAQMGLKSFSHCMVSHDDFDDNATGDLVLTTERSCDGKFNYTPFLTNPRHFSDSYYVELQSISVGGVVIKVPDEHAVPNATGYGGTIVDSGTSVTMMTKPVFDLVFKEFQSQVSNKYKRVKRVESETGLKPCYRVPAIAAGIKLPQLTFTFKGVVEMVLPLSNYFSYADDEQHSVLCMTIMSLGDDFGLPPAIILGNYQQHDFYIKYDLENNQFGIRQQKCIPKLG